MLGKRRTEYIKFERMNRYSRVFIEPAVEKPAAEIYRQRRAALLQKLDTVGVFCGVNREPGTEEVFVQTWNKMIQEPAFLYLTGINQAGCKMILDPLAENPDDREVLFLPKKDSAKEFWTGEKLGFSDEGVDTLRALTGFRNILPETSFWNFLTELVERRKCKTVKAFYWEFSTEAGIRRVAEDHNAQFASELKRRLPENAAVESLAQEHLDKRVVLDAAQLSDARRAVAWTKKAFCEFLKNLKSFKTERDAQLFLDYRMQMQSDGDLAFPTIMACGKNASCLHYVKNDEKLETGKLLLMDFGIRAGTLHSDISRTIPVNGKFDPLQRILYSIVLDAQKFHAKNVRPGEKLVDLDRAVWDYILKELESRLVSAGGRYRLLYDVRPHGVSHLIGEQIHEGDPFRLYMQKPLEPGMLLSNEPGLYGHFELEVSGIRYKEDVGIRIENDLLVTDSGCEDISADIPKEIDELEGLLA